MRERKKKGPFKVWSCTQAILFMLVKRRVGGGGGGVVCYRGAEPNSWLILELLERKKRKVCLSLEFLFSQKADFIWKSTLFGYKMHVCVQKNSNPGDFVIFFLVKSFSHHIFLATKMVLYFLLCCCKERSVGKSSTGSSHWDLCIY